MKQLLLVLTFCLPLAASAQKQKIEVENDKIYLDDSLYARIETDGCRGFGGCEYTIKNKARQTILIVKLNSVKLSSEVSQSNPQGNFTYYDFIFPKSGHKAQVSDKRLTAVRLGKMMVKYELMRNKDIDLEAVNTFALLYPVKY